MKKHFRTWKQEKWQPQLDVEVWSGAEIRVAGRPVETDREQALAWIILRLNAQVLGLQAERDAMKEKMQEDEKLLDFLAAMMYALLIED